MLEYKLPNLVPRSLFKMTTLLSQINMICLVDSPTSVVVSGKCDNCRTFYASEVSALKWQSCKRSRTLMVTSITPYAPTKWSASSHIVERPHRYWLWEREKTCDCQLQKKYFLNWRPPHSGMETNQGWTNIQWKMKHLGVLMHLQDILLKSSV